MRNPKWVRDEVILALDLYFRTEYKDISSSNQEIKSLSDLLNQLPIHKGKEVDHTFRNANGVALKLANFAALDPEAGNGMSSYSKMDEAVFQEFRNHREDLRRIANQIKSAVSDDATRLQLYGIPGEDEDQVDYVKEGRVLYKLHKFRERDAKIIGLKKKAVLREFGKLECEVCVFDFHTKYGRIGQDFIECHHTTPLSHFEDATITSLNDLALVCSNCHRMLHREISVLSIADLRDIVQSNPTSYRP